MASEEDPFTAPPALTDDEAAVVWVLRDVEYLAGRPRPTTYFDHLTGRPGPLPDDTRDRLALYRATVPEGERKSSRAEELLSRQDRADARVVLDDRMLGDRLRALGARFGVELAAYDQLFDAARGTWGLGGPGPDPSLAREAVGELDALREAVARAVRIASRRDKLSRERSEQTERAEGERHFRMLLDAVGNPRIISVWGGQRGEWDAQRYAAADPGDADELLADLWIALARAVRALGRAAEWRSVTANEILAYHVLRSQEIDRRVVESIIECGNGLCDLLLADEAWREGSPTGETRTRAIGIVSSARAGGPEVLDRLGTYAYAVEAAVQARAEAAAEKPPAAEEREPPPAREEELAALSQRPLTEDARKAARVLVELAPAKGLQAIEWSQKVPGVTPERLRGGIRKELLPYGLKNARGGRGYYFPEHCKPAVRRALGATE